MSNKRSNEAYQPKYAAKVKNDEIRICISQTKAETVCWYDKRFKDHPEYFINDPCIFLVYKPRITFEVSIKQSEWHRIEQYESTAYNVHAMRYRLLEPLLRPLFVEHQDLHDETYKATLAIQKALRKENHHDIQTVKTV